MWTLNGNGLSYLTPAEQAKVASSDNINLRFPSAHHGMVSSDGEAHLMAGDRIVGQWTDAPLAAPFRMPAPPPPFDMPAPPQPEPVLAIPAGDGLSLTAGDLAAIGNIVSNAVRRAMGDDDGSE